MHPNCISQKSGSIMHASIKPSLAQETQILRIIKILPLFYSPLNSNSDGSNYRSFQGKSAFSAGFNSFISFPCFFATLCWNRAITWPIFLLQTFACCHLVPHIRNSTSDGVVFLHNKKRWLPNELKWQMISRQGATIFCKDCIAGVIPPKLKLYI